MIKRINVSKLPKTDEELQDLILEIKSYIDEHSFYGKFCQVHMYRENWAGIPIKNIRVEVIMFPTIWHNDTPLRIGVQETKVEPLEIIQSARWKDMLACVIDQDFTNILAKNYSSWRSITNIQFNRVEMYKDKEERTDSPGGENFL